MEHHSRPVPWLTDNRHLLPRSGIALDVACGRGRHALWLAGHGFFVRAVDRDRDVIARLNDEALRREVAIDASVVDLESGDPELGIEHFDLIVAVNYLHRPLFPFLLAALRSQGVLVYETFTREQALRGKPTNPDYLLEPGELRRLVGPLSILASREGEDRGQFTASIVARKDVRSVRL
jgi:SAM-dependent methyltransferase